MDSFATSHAKRLWYAGLIPQHRCTMLVVCVHTGCTRVLAAGNGASPVECAQHASEAFNTNEHNSSTTAATATSTQHHEDASAQLRHTSTQPQYSSAARKSNRSALYAAHAADISETAAQLLPRKTSADKGGFIEFLLLVSEEGNLPAFQVGEALPDAPFRSSGVP